jgi:hypothetical protein
MLQGEVILIFAFTYLGLLFAIAYYGDKRADIGRSIISNPYIYTLSIAVYCTAWTFYGSVGRASDAGVGFLPIYLGPTLMAVLWWFVLRKIIRIAKTQRITSIADFIGSRYGKSTLLAGLVTIIAVVGIMPYISLQLKAVSTSYIWRCCWRHSRSCLARDTSMQRNAMKAWWRRLRSSPWSSCLPFWRSVCLSPSVFFPGRQIFLRALQMSPSSLFSCASKACQEATRAGRH